jgi:chromosome segregation ATPase
MKSKEAQIRKQEADLLRRKQTWEFTHKRQQKEIEGLTEELREAHIKMRQLEQQIRNMEDYAEEVHALRNYAYKEERDDHNIDNAPSINTMAEFIQSKRLVIFGGSPNWRQKLKEYLPTVEFVDVDDKNRDISKIQRVDAVFINTSVFAHAFYKKIIKELTKSKTPLYYLNGQSNTEKNILEIYDWLTD